MLMPYYVSSHAITSVGTTERGKSLEIDFHKKFLKSVSCDLKLYSTVLTCSLGQFIFIRS